MNASSTLDVPSENHQGDQDEMLPSQGNDSDIDYDDDDDDDDSSLLVDVPLIEHPGQASPKKLEEPPEGLQWNDDAILECFQLAVATHDQTTTILPQATHADSNDNYTLKILPFEWSAPTNNNSKSSDMEFLSTWKPKSLPLPIWAVDPFVAAAKATTIVSANEEGGLDKK
jgi:hypothetical protein